LAQAQIKLLTNPDTSPTKRERAYAALEAMPGDEKNGRSVFSRLCVSCHKVNGTGYTFGPDLSDVGKRITRREIIESITEPSKKVDPKYVTTTVTTAEGKVEVGFIIAKTDDSITLLMAEDKRKTIPLADIDEMQETNLSSMPENLASTLAPAEFLDIVEFLATRK
jgi:putative heme-binding domain-containing protein